MKEPWQMERKTYDKASIERYIKAEWEPLRDGVRWKCIRCSSCCKKPWTINLTWHEYDRLAEDERAKGLPGPSIEVDPETGLDHPFFTIKGKCPMFREEGSACTLYPDWPYTCATYPFLVLPSGDIVVHRECSGFGQGPIIDANAMRERIIRERRKAGMAGS